MLAFLLLLLPLSAPVNHVDVIELNHFCDCQTGKEVFRQWIFWEMRQGELELVDWRLCKGEAFSGGSLLVDGKLVKGESFRETWTDFDPELAAREKTPKEKRKLLR